MKIHRVAPARMKAPKKLQARVYRDLEIAMERRALAVHPAAEKKQKTAK